METRGTALVTGANSGIGLQLTLRLLEEGWQVAALVRSEFGQDGALEVARARGQLRVYRADLGQPASLEAAAKLILAEESRIDILFNNAGVAPGQLATGVRGLDLAFEVNTLAPYLLTKALLPLLRAGTGKTVVNTSSAAALLVRSFSTDLLLHPTRFAPFSGPYGRSKLALSLWTQAWAPTLATEGIRLISVDPGANHTVMNNPWRKSGTPGWIRWIQRLTNKHPSYGADLLYRAAFGPSGPGAFLVGNRPRGVPFAHQARSVLALVESMAGNPD